MMRIDSSEAGVLKVLIVEDEFFIALDTQSVVEELGHAVVGIAVSADQALDAVARERPDVVLMDIRIVGPRDGIAAADEIRTRFGVGSIFLTANTDPATLARACVVAPIAVLHKPLTPVQLREALAQVGRA